MIFLLPYYEAGVKATALISSPLFHYHSHHNILLIEWNALNQLVLVDDQF